MKRFLVILTLTALLMSLALPCYAAGAVMEPTEDPSEEVNEAKNVVQENSTDSEYASDRDGRKIPSGLRDADEAAIRRFFAEHPEELVPPDDCADEMKLEALQKAAATWIYTRDARGIGFYYYAQEASNTCSCACARMCLKGVAGVSVTEQQAVIGMGVIPNYFPGNVEDAVNYINSKQSKYSYDDKYTSSEWWFHFYQLNAIQHGAPTIVGIVTEKDQWVYNDLVGQGHGICCYAIKSDKSAYMVADPWGGYSGRTDCRWFPRTASQLWTAYSSRKGYAA